MKHKLLTVLLALSVAVCCALGLAACQKEKQFYTVTYDAVGGTISAEETLEQSAEEGTFLEKPTDPVRSGYEFGGWAKDEAGTQLWVFAVDKLSSDVTLYAVWSQIYTVTFDAGSGTFAGDSRTATVKATENSAITAPQAPEREGYVLSGWTTDSRGQRVWDFKLDKVSADITLYAVWAKEQTITFNANGGSFSNTSGKALILADEEVREDEIKTVTVARGFKIDEPSAPYLSGYLFKGWFTQKEGGLKWDFYNDTVTNDLTLYARWEEIVDDYEVTYELNYDGAKAVVLQTENGYATYEPEERAGYIFNGWWYGTKSGGKVTLTARYDETKRITNDTTLYADWIDESKIISRLATPSVTRTNGVFSWNAVDGAVGYTVRVSTSSVSGVIKSYNTNSTSWTFPSDSLYEKGVMYYVSVKAKGNGVNTVSSGYSNGTTYTYRALAQTVIRMDWTTNVVSWTEVTNASSYELSVNGEVIRTSSSTSYDMSEYEADFYTIKVVAKDIYNNYVESTTTQSVAKYKLLTPEVSVAANVKDKAYCLVFGGVRNADCFKITAEGKTYIAEGNSFMISDSSLWNKKEEITVTVCASNSASDFITSEPCELTLKKLVKVTISNSEGVESTDVKLNGNTFKKEISYKLSFELNGGKGSISEQTVSASNPIVYPKNPERDGYVFKGWFTDAACTNPFDFTKDLIADTTVFAGWHAMTGSGYTARWDISGDIDSSGFGYPVSGKNTSSQLYLYFTAFKTGTIRIYYRLSSSYSHYLTIYNETKRESVMSSSNISNTMERYIETTVTAGDVIRVNVYGASSNSRTYSISVYVKNSYGSTYGNIPEAGGAATEAALLEMGASSANAHVLEAGSGITLSAPATLNGKKFVGWYRGDKCVSTSVTYVVHEVNTDVEYVAKYE